MRSRCPRDPAAVGETLHLVDPEPITASEVSPCSPEYAGREPSYRLPPSLVVGAPAVEARPRRLRRCPGEAIRYLNHPVRYDTRRSDEMLERHGLRAPRFEDYVGPVVRFFAEHEEDQAFTPGSA